MTHSNRITLRIFLPTRQLSKLVDYWINMNGERARALQGCRQYQKTGVWVSKRVKFAEGRSERAIMAERTRIAACKDRCPTRITGCKDRWGDNNRCGKCRCVRPRALSHLEACGKNRAWVHVLPCCVDVDTVHGCCKATGLPLFLPQTSLLHEKCQEVERAKTYRIGTKLSQSFYSL